MWYKTEGKNLIFVTLCLSFSSLYYQPWLSSRIFWVGLSSRIFWASYLRSKKVFILDGPWSVIVHPGRFLSPMTHQWMIFCSIADLMHAILARCRDNNSDVSCKRDSSLKVVWFDDFTLALYKFNFLFHQAAIQ